MITSERKEAASIGQCINTASGFLSVGNSLSNIQDGVQYYKYYIAPCATTLAFSCELFLKAIYAMENNGDMCKGHYLEELYGKLSVETQGRICAEYNRRQGFPSIAQCLHMHNTTFESFRYLYEENECSVDVPSLKLLAYSLSNACKDMWQLRER